jgi:hypothetical protein
MKKLALLLLITGLQLSSSAQTWPLSGWPFSLTTGQYWGQSLAPDYGYTNYGYYNFLTNSMINDVLTSSNNFYDAPPLNPKSIWRIKSTTILEHASESSMY